MAAWKMYLAQTRHEKSSLENVCCIFEDNYIFVNNFHTSCPSYQPIPLKCSNKFYGFQEPWDRGPTYEAEGQGTRNTNTRLSNPFP